MVLFTSRKKTTKRDKAIEDTVLKLSLGIDNDYIQSFR